MKTIAITGLTLDYISSALFFPQKNGDPYGVIRLEWAFIYDLRHFCQNLRRTVLDHYLLKDA